VLHTPDVQIGTVHLPPTGAMAGLTPPPPPPQSLAEQHAAQAVPQQSAVVPPHADLCTHLWAVVSQESVVQPLLSLQSASALHSMQPPLVGSHVKPAPHAALFAVCVHCPPEQLSVVQAIKSSQSVSAQHAPQPTPVQHLPPDTQVANEHLPPTHEPL
jgi:hypothetical protein